MCYLEEGKAGISAGNSQCRDTDRVRRREKQCRNTQQEHTGPFQGENPSWHQAQGRCREAGCSPGTPRARPAPHRDAADAVELMMPYKAEASPSSVVSATMHPQAMDQRGYEKIRRNHFNFKTWKFWHGRSLQKISSVMYPWCVEGECCILNVHTHIPIYLSKQYH